MSLRSITKSLVMLALISSTVTWGDLSNFNKADAYPRFTTLQPHQYLYTYYTDELKKEKVTWCNPENFGVFLSPFGQNATIGANADNIIVALGDLEGRWNILGLLFGAVPAGQTLPPVLATARAALFPNLPPGFVIDDNSIVDPQHNFGYFSVPLNYRKGGVRAEFQTMLFCDIGIQIQAGVADIFQVTGTFINRTGQGSFVPPPSIPTLTVANVNTFLMDQIDEIAEELGLNIENFHEFSLEDPRIDLFWRHAYFINEFRPTWPKFLLIPFVDVGFAAAIAKNHNYNKVFAVPFSNNNSNAVGFDMGLNLDFIETVEIGAHAGITHFFSKERTCFMMPTDDAQSGIFPFKSDVIVQPGRNLLFGLKLNARHFLDMLSFYFEYVLVDHDPDCFKLRSPDAAFFPVILRDRSSWKVQVINTALNYDISPNVSLGFLWQAPVAERNAYRSTTVMVSFNATF